MRTPWFLVRRHLLAHWIRSGLTLSALTVAIFLLCFLLSIVTTLESYVKAAASDRIITQSAVSLFVDLPRDYQPKIDGVGGVDEVTKFQWFGGYYRDRSSWFAQFGVETDKFFDMYAADMRIVEGPGGTTGDAALAAVREAMANDRRACFVGKGLVRDFGWRVGDTIPLISTIFAKPGNEAWEFIVAGTYEKKRNNFDDRTLFFRFDYLAETLDAGGAQGPTGVGTFATNLVAAEEASEVIDEIDGLFENGPQRTLTVTEAAFQAAFVSMMGNVPLFVATIGGAVVFAVFFSVVNTMLMAGRQRVHEAGIMKALGFRDGVFTRLVLAESILLGLAGGGLGVLLALGSVAGIQASPMAATLPNYAVEPQTVAIGLMVSLAVGLIAGLAPGIGLARLRPTDALRSEG